MRDKRHFTENMKKIIFPQIVRDNIPEFINQNLTNRMKCLREKTNRKKYNEKDD